jgi:large subunit ribosomal protein L31e
MADSKTPAAEEKLFTIPLRKEFLKVPMNKRAKRSMNTIRKFLSRHMKVPETEVRISPMLNQTIWVRGAAKPPSKVRIKATLDMKEGLLFAGMPDELPPAPKDEKKSETKPPVDKDAVKELVEKATQKATSTPRGTGKDEVKKLVDQAVAEGKAKEDANPETETKKAEPVPKKAQAKKPVAKKPSPAKKK